MGYIRHHAILVTSFSDNRAEALHTKAKEIFGDSVSEILPASTNGYRTFLIGPDGSKEYWAESEVGNQRREDFKAWLKKDVLQCYPTWAEVQYGDENGDNAVLDHG